MRVVYYTSAKTGSGHIVLGLSVYNGLKRAGEDFSFSILTSAAFTDLAERIGVSVRRIPGENEHHLSRSNYKTSALYRTLLDLKPDVLIVDLSWFTLYQFIDELECKKIFLCRQIEDAAFIIPLPEGPLRFEPDHYDRVFAIEPFESSLKMERLNPLIIRNRDEILPREAALHALGGGESEKEKEGSKLCLFAFNGKPGEFEEKRKTYAYLEDEGYTIFYTSNFHGGLFPAVDYFNAVDLLICGAGYNAFWEAVYFKKDAIFVPVRRRFENQRLRVETCAEFEFTENGADQLAREIFSMGI